MRAHRVHAARQFFRQTLRNQNQRTAIIRFRQKTPADQPYARCPEIIRTNKSPIRIRPLLFCSGSFLEIHIIAPHLAR